jgi:predicted RNase H-like nuclease
MDEYSEVFHGKTAAQWAQHHGLVNLAREIDYYVSGRDNLRSTLLEKSNSICYCRHSTCIEN